MSELTKNLRKPLPLHPDGFVRGEKLYRLIGHDIEFDLRIERKESADRIEALEKAMAFLLEAASDVNQRGATTGRQWIKLGSAIISSCAVLKDRTTP